ncbi:MAG: 2-hydroxyacyl-CoA dehydratase, partial [Desulfovibrio sp.]|nr:2-hydroxyacyl-CoA dehydratase [Desulfovibrio sp.]
MAHASLDTFRAITDRNVLRLQEAKQAGRKVVGQYCIYTPLEMVLAVGAVPVSLCGTKNDSIPAAEAMLPRTLCPLIKSSFGFALQDSCPYLAASDLVVADTTCDGKKKMFELLAKRKPVFVLQLPQTQDADAITSWRRQLELFKDRLEQDFGIELTEAGLRDAIALSDRFRQALKRVLDLGRRKPSP